MNTDYFVAVRDRAMTLVEWGPGGTELPKLLMKWVEPGILGSQLWGIIEDLPASEKDVLPIDFDRYYAVGEVLKVSDGEEGSFGLVQIADGFVRALATLPDERIAPVAERWATSEEWLGPWEPHGLDSTVEGLRDLARCVHGPDQRMYVWWSM
ncbi:hypothetical protein AB0J72_18800 [Dactylosporangium sp. NPDC049742]|uniref:hypothetical protein n=1 Tax=Dactylosporangium sp. NPDC049742 TaxID=3154737 RepID=UPI003426035F